MEYPDWIIEDAKARANILLGPKNKSPTSYKNAYELLRASIEKAQTLYKEHREKAERQLSGIIPKEKVDGVLKRRLAENKSLVRIRQKPKPTEDFEIKFKTGAELLDLNLSQDTKTPPLLKTLKTPLRVPLPCHMRPPGALASTNSNLFKFPVGR